MNANIDTEKVLDGVREASYIFIESLSLYYPHSQLSITAAQSVFPIIAEHVLLQENSVDCIQQLQRFLKATTGSACFDEIWSEFKNKLGLDYIMDHYDAADEWNEKELVAVLSCWDYGRGFDKARIKPSDLDKKIKDLEGFLLSEGGMYESFYQVCAKILCKRSSRLNESFHAMFDEVLKKTIDVDPPSSIKPR